LGDAVRRVGAQPGKIGDGQGLAWVDIRSTTVPGPGAHGENGVPTAAPGDPHSLRGMASHQRRILVQARTVLLGDPVRGPSRRLARPEATPAKALRPTCNEILV